MDSPRRKQMRLPTYDYSSNGAYFVTACTHNKVKLFGDIGSDSIASQMISFEFEHILSRYPQICCPKYVVMPNHFHALVVIDKMDDSSSSTIAEMMQSFKSKTTVEYIRLVNAGKARPFDRKVWQRSYYDHVIRNERDFQEVWKYIDENPLRWELDGLFTRELKFALWCLATGQIFKSKQ